jgi:uncharacterized protein YjbI with pentapeptide repeats
MNAEESFRSYDSQELLQRYSDGERNFQGVRFYEINIDILEDVDLSESDFSNTSFLTCGLDGVNFERSIFRSATVYASLKQANFRFADLQSAIFCERLSDGHSHYANGSSLFYADLIGANLSHADFCMVDFRGADLTDANLRMTDLRSADLRRANLRRADLSQANLSNANLCYADLTDAILSDANLKDAKWAGAILPDGTRYQYETLELIKAKIEHLRRPAWKPVVKNGDGDLKASKFAGQPWLDVNDTWPICPHCREPMQFFLQLNLQQLPEELANRFGNGLLQFFYCANDSDTCCEEHVPERGAAFASHQFIRIVQSDENPIAIDTPEIQSDSSSKIEDEQFLPKLIVDWQQIDDYPNWADAELQGVSITDEELERIATDELQAYPESISDCSYLPDEDRIFNERSQRDGVVTAFMMDAALLPFWGDKLAGWPHWVQYIEYPNCPVCERLMDQLIFEFASNDHIPYLWGDVGTGYILQCPEHKDQVAFLWQCG